MSLPITMRSILKKAAPDLDLQIEKLAVLPPPAVTTPISRMGLERRQAFIEARHAGARASVDRQLSMQSTTGSYSASSSVSSAVLAASMEALIMGYHDPSPPQDMNHQLTSPREDRASKNPMLASLLDENTNSPEMPQPSMLSQLLNNENGGQNAVAKQKKQRKRKSASTSDVRSPGSSGRSPKRKPNEDEFGGALKDYSSVDMDASAMHHNSNSFDMSQHMTPQPPEQHVNFQQRSQQQPVYGNSNESHVSRLASSVDNIIKQESKNFSGVPPHHHAAGLDMSQAPAPPPYSQSPMLLAHEIKQEKIDLEMQQQQQQQNFAHIKREGGIPSHLMGTSHGNTQTAANRQSKGNSLADLLKTDSPSSEAPSMPAPTSVSLSTAASLPKKEFSVPSQPASDRSVGFGSKSHRSFDSALTNSASKSHDFKRSNSVESLDSPPAKIKPEGSNKSVNMLLAKNSIGREKTKFSSDGSGGSSNYRPEDKQNSINAMKDRIKKEKRDEESTPRLKLKLPKDVSSKKEGLSTPSTADSQSSSQDPFDHAKAITPKEPMRLSYKEKYSDKEHIYDLGSDPEESGPLPQLGPARSSSLNSDSSKTAVKIRKLKSPEDGKLIKRKSTSKYDGENPKKRRRERDSSSDSGKRDKIKKKKVYDAEAEFGGGHAERSSSNASLTSSKPRDNKFSTTIRISTDTSGKLQITPKLNRSPSSSSSQSKLALKSGSSSSGSTSMLSGSKHFKSASSTSKLSRPPGSSKQFSRSKSDPHGTELSNRMDKKLTTKTPTIKLKPIDLVTVNAAGSKTPQSSTPSQSGSKSASVKKTVSKSGSKPPLQQKQRLSAVIDNLKQKKQGPPTLSQKLEKIEQRSSGKGDILSKKNKQDSIIKEILIEGFSAARSSVPSQPKDSFKSSHKKSDSSSRLSSESGFSRLEKPSSGTGPGALLSTPIPKISKNNSASPAGLPNIPIPKISSSSTSTTKSASSNTTNKFGSSASASSRSSGSSSASGAQGTESSRNSGGSKESSYSSKGPSGALGGNDAGRSSSSGVGSKGGSAPPGGVSGNAGANSSQASLDAIRRDMHNSSSRKPDQGLRHGDSYRENHSPSVTSQKLQQTVHNSKDSSEDSSKQRSKPDDPGDRSQGRHFLDALGSSSSGHAKGDGKNESSSSSKESSHKSSLKRQTSSGSSGEHSGKSDHYSGSHGVENKSRINGLNNGSGSSTSRSSPKEGISRSSPSVKEIHSVKTSEHHSSSDRNSAKPVSGSSKQVNSLDHNHRTSKPHSTGSSSGYGSNGPNKVSSHLASGTSSLKLTNSHGDTVNSGDTLSKQDNASSFDNKENTSIASPDPEGGVFKAPTPKTELESRPSRLDRIKPIRSPGSNPSSPEDGLVIDCPGTPNSNNKPSKSPSNRSTDRSPVTGISRSPVCTTNASGPPSAGEIRSKSPATALMLNKMSRPHSPSVRKPILTNKLPPPASPSPPKSPMMQHNSPAANRRDSPVEIDDDLMDEAITM